MGEVTTSTSRSAYFLPGVLARLEADDDHASYATSIETVEDASLLVTAPIKSGVVVPFARGAKLTLVVDRRNNPHFFDVRALEMIRVDEKAFLRISRPPGTFRRR